MSCATGHHGGETNWGPAALHTLVVSFCSCLATLAKTFVAGAWFLFLQGKLEKSPVFSHILARTVEAMQKASEQMTDRHLDAVAVFEKRLIQSLATAGDTDKGPGVGGGISFTRRIRTRK